VERFQFESWNSPQCGCGNFWSQCNSYTRLNVLWKKISFGTYGPMWCFWYFHGNQNRQNVSANNYRMDMRTNVWQVWHINSSEWSYLCNLCVSSSIKCCKKYLGKLKGAYRTDFEWDLDTYMCVGVEFGRCDNWSKDAILWHIGMPGYLIYDTINTPPFTQSELL
jgi:hypothetical protein